MGSGGHTHNALCPVTATAETELGRRGEQWRCRNRIGRNLYHWRTAATLCSLRTPAASGRSGSPDTKPVPIPEEIDPLLASSALAPWPNLADARHCSQPWPVSAGPHRRIHPATTVRVGWLARRRHMANGRWLAGPMRAGGATSPALN